MPIDPQLQSQLAAWYKKQQATYQDSIDQARANANVKSWGGSAADAKHWSNAIGQRQQALSNLNNQYQAMVQLADQGSLNLNNIQIIQKAITGDTVAQQQVNELSQGNIQLSQQNKQLQDFRDQLETQYFGGKGLSLTDALSSTGGDIGNLGKFLQDQEARTFNEQLKPLIQMALGSQGLSDSGGQVELQSKALGQLDQARQQALMQAALGMRSQVQGLQREDILGDVGYRQQMLSSQSDLARADITMQFQQQLENQREQLARDLASRQGGGGGGLLNKVLGGVGAAASVGLAPYTGGMSLAAMPSFLNMATSPSYGGGSGSMMGAQGLGMLGQAFGQSGFFSAAPRSQSYSQYGPYRSGYRFPPASMGGPSL